MATFHVPTVEPDDERTDHDRLNGLLHRAAVPLPPDAVPVQSVTWDQGKTEEWTATVGQQLRGKTIKTLPTGRRVVIDWLSDSATVLAIVPAVAPGRSFRVITNAKPIATSPSRWANPLQTTTDLREVTAFDPEPEAEEG